MKKIGIITFHYALNYGSVLQEYAFKNLLEKKGYKVSIINFICRRDYDQYKLFRTRYYIKHPYGFLVDCLLYGKNKKRKENFRRFILKNFSLTKKYYSSKDMKELNDMFDVFICGSDQIWNLDCTKNVEPAYFLNFVDEKKLKIAYAPSLGHVKFKKDYSNDLKIALKDIDYISIREKSTLPLIKYLTNKNIEIVLDPTLLLNKDNYTNIINTEKNIEFNYIFVYMLEYNNDLIDYCNEIADIYNMEIIYINKSAKLFNKIKGKDAFGVGPARFLFYIKNAEYIITNSFHATVFSIIFNKKFMTFTTKKSSARILDLLEKLDIKERVYKKGCNISDNINYKKVMQKLNELRKTSLEYLDRALNRG